MAATSPLEADRTLGRRATAVTLQLTVLGGWVALCARFIAPFFFPVIWGAVLATAVWPLFGRLSPERRKLGALLFALLAWASLFVPAWFLLDALATSIVGAGRRMASGEFRLPPPDERLLHWPVVGKRIYEGWAHLVEAPAGTLERFLPQLRSLGRVMLGSVAGFVSSVLAAAVSVGIAALFLANADPCHRGLTRVAEKLVPRRGPRFVALAASTVRSVAQGVVGTALIQAVAAAAALYLVGVPAAGVWSGLVLMVAVMQLPPLLVLGPISAYVFSTSSTSTGVVFLLWSILVNVSDGLLKPLVLGRGQSVPTLVILLGAIGGMITDGVLGLFVGAVVLSVGYELAVAWLDDDGTVTAETPAPPSVTTEPELDRPR